MDIIEMITNRLKKLAVEHKEAKTRKEMLDEYLNNDEEYIGLKDTAKEASRRLSAHKQALFNEPENRKIIQELKDVQKEIKDLKALLSGDLLAVFVDKNTLEFEDAEGNLRKIKIRAEVNKTNQPSLF